MVQRCVQQADRCWMLPLARLHKTDACPPGANLKLSELASSQTLPNVPTCTLLLCCRACSAFTSSRAASAASLPCRTATRSDMATTQPPALDSQKPTGGAGVCVKGLLAALYCTCTIVSAAGSAAAAECCVACRCQRRRGHQSNFAACSLCQ